MTDYVIMETMAGSTPDGGTTFLAEEKGSNKMVVIKKIKQQTDSRQIGKEVEYLKKLACHPFVSCYKDHFMGDDDENLYIVTEYIAGLALGQTAKAIQKLGLEALYYDFIYSNLCLSIQGLYYIHSRNVIHGNIKPENIILRQSINYQADENGNKINQTYQPTFVDFGLSCSLTDDPCLGIIGTRLFVAPEVIETNKRYPKSDVWSLGLSYYETIDPILWPDTDLLSNDDFFNYVVSGKRIFHVDTPNQKLNDLLNKMLIYDMTSRPNSTILYEEIRQRSPINNTYL